MDLNIDISCDAWHGVAGAEAVVEKAVLAGLAEAGVPPAGTEVSVVLSDDDFVADLNQQWRGKSWPTNVLSFPVAEDMAAAADEPRFIGDIVLAWGVVAQQASDAGKPLATHLSHLVVHGVLHLLGYDHLDDEAAGQMQALETRAMARLNMPDPYANYEETAVLS
jgi:probable rRNA maturation factor